MTLKRPELNLRPVKVQLSKEIQTLHWGLKKRTAQAPLSVLTPSSLSTGEKVQTKGGDETIVFTNLAAESDGSAEETCNPTRNSKISARITYEESSPCSDSDTDFERIPCKRYRFLVHWRIN